MTRINRAVIAKPQRTLHDWEIFVGLAKAFATRAERELKSTIAPAQMVGRGLRAGLYGDASGFRLSLETLLNHPHARDLGALKPNLALHLRTANQRIQAAPRPILAIWHASRSPCYRKPASWC